MAAQICLKTDVALSTRIIRETLSNKWTPAVFASRMLIRGLRTFARKFFNIDFFLKLLPL